MAEAGEKTNRLASESSAYLTSAAHQPIDWHPWGDEPFRLAKEQGKPVLLDIGAVWCHWCHVMDGESYEDEEVARDFGVPTFWTKAQALTISSVFPGIMGSLYTWYINYIITDDIYSIAGALTPIAMAMLGGSGLLIGPVLGAVFLYGAEELILINLEHLHGAILGLVIVLVGLFMPGGLARIPVVSRLLGRLGLLERPR